MLNNKLLFWTELYRLSPASVERCACVWQFNGARRALRRILAEQNERLIESMPELPAADAASGLMDADELMRQLDVKYRDSRRRTWVALVIVGAILTFQPWLALGWFAMVILIGGLMLCALEYSPKTGEGFVALVLRMRKEVKQAPSRRCPRHRLPPPMQPWPAEPIGGR